MSFYDEITAKAAELNLGNASDETLKPLQTPTPRNDGYWQKFERGWVYWSPANGAHAVMGAVFAKWAETGWEQGFLGFPVTDELPTPDGIGRFNHFESGSIYWTAETGAHYIHGGILATYADMGWERSYLGYPTSDESLLPNNAGWYNDFQRGRIVCTAQGDIQVTQTDQKSPENPLLSRYYKPSYEGVVIDDRRVSDIQLDDKPSYEDVVVNDRRTIDVQIGNKPSYEGVVISDQRIGNIVLDENLSERLRAEAARTYGGDQLALITDAVRYYLAIQAGLQMFDRQQMLQKLQRTDITKVDPSEASLLMAGAIASDPNFSSEQVDKLAALMARIAALVPELRGM